MRKRNKILMIIVSVLLCLTLISFCCLSNIFAKYTTQKDRKFVMNLQKYGITLEVAFPKIDGVTVEENQSVLGNNKIYSTRIIEFTDLKLIPGNSYNNVVQFTFSGKPSVDVNVIIDVDVTYIGDNFKVPAKIGGLTAETIYFPINLTYGKKVGNTWTNIGNHGLTRTDEITADNWVNERYIEQQYMTQVKDYFLNPYTSAKGTLNSATDNGSSVTWTFEKGKEVCFKNSSNQTITGIAFGFEWPLNYTTSSNNTNWNLRETHIANNEPTLTVTFSVTIEQKTNS